MQSEMRDSRILPFDCVYFLMFDGWKEEMRANRWHYASRWARHFHVVLVQPSQAVVTPTFSESEPRISNCRILHVKSATNHYRFLSDSLVQLAQVQMDMHQHGYSRPLLWCYNPQLVGLFAGVHSVARIYHASENYFHFTERPDWFYGQLKTALRISDIVIAVSNGVASSIRDNVPGAAVSVVSNGCDSRCYSVDGVQDPELSRLRRGRTKVAIYGGRINGRIDFHLLLKLSAANPQVLFAFAGPVVDLSTSQLCKWTALLKAENVRYLGVVEVDRLPAIYRASDVGIIPYSCDRLLVENGFPLKTLEMAATGLPVVTSLMKPIVGLACGIKVTDSVADFVAAFGETSRQQLPQLDLDELHEVCRRNDYEIKFAQVVELISASLPQDAPPRSRLDILLSDMIADQWPAMAACDWQCEEHPRIDVRYVVYRLLIACYLVLPTALRQVIPKQLRVTLTDCLLRREQRHSFGRSER